MAKQALLVVDVQRGFINDYTRHIPGRVKRLIELDDFEPVLFTQFVNVPESSYHRLLQWHDVAQPPDTDLVPELAGCAAAGRVFVKPGRTGVTEELSSYVREQGLQRLSLVGIDTDMCVLKMALDLFDLGVEPVVLVDCCASTAGLQAHLAGLSILSRNIGPHQLRLTRLHETYLAAPPND
jgi:nicotinamidase-related amidase